MERRRLFILILGASLLFVFLRSIGWPPGQDDGLTQVMYVIDGDTIVVEGGQQVRYIGIDTPEITRGDIQCYGEEATERNKELVAGKRVLLVPDITDRDKYDRLLRYVYVDETFVNRSLIESGHARTLYIEPDTRYYAFFADAQERAKTTGLGLWSACR